MTSSKRIFDVFLALSLLLLLLPLFFLVSVVAMVKEGRPIFFFSERMKTPDVAFTLVKFRTMSADAGDAGVTGGDKSNRVSRFQAFLRKSRLDEMPQLLNILRGDMSFVGPRPPLRMYVELFPEIYGNVLKSRPGITGLGTLGIHRYEERVLAECETPEQTDLVYRKRCIPKKARLDLIYQRNRSLCFDCVLIARTALRPLSTR